MLMHEPVGVLSEQDRRCVADALDGVYHELEALFAPSSTSWSLLELVVLQLVVAIMYDVWLFGEANVGQKLHIKRKMKRLLCSEGFLSLPSRVCNQCLLSQRARSKACSARSEAEDFFSMIDMFKVDSLEQNVVAAKIDLLMRGMMVKGIALGAGGNQLARCFNAPSLKNHLKDIVKDFLESFNQLETPLFLNYTHGIYEVRYSPVKYCQLRLEEESFCFAKLKEEEVRVLINRVRKAVGSVAAELEEVVVAHTIKLAHGPDADSLNSRFDESSSDYSSDEADYSDYDYSSDEADCSDYEYSSDDANNPDHIDSSSDES